MMVEKSLNASLNLIAPPHSDMLKDVSRDILTGRISVSLRRQMVHGSLREPVEELTNSLGREREARGIERVSEEEGWVSGAKR